MPGSTPPGFFARHLTQVVFWTTLLLFLVSLWLFLSNQTLPFFGVTAASVLFDLWAVVRNERGGFIRVRQMRRAYEPARNFNGAQVFIVLSLVMIQAGLAVFAVFD